MKSGLPRFHPLSLSGCRSYVSAVALSAQFTYRNDMSYWNFLRCTKPLLACILLAGVLLEPVRAGGDTSAGVSVYNIIWDSPSEDAFGSMPLGNGSTSLNAWVEPTGDLCFYIGRTDSWGDNARLLKLGKVRISLDPVPAIRPFQQTLSLSDATINVCYGKEPEATRLRLWVDANHPVIHVTIDSARPTSTIASIELWRTNRHELSSIEVSDVQTDRDRPNNMHGPTIVEPDTLLTGSDHRIGWYHRNIKSVGPAEHARVQGMTEYPRKDPLLGRTFGAIITTEDGERVEDRKLRSPVSRSHRFSIYVDTLHPATEEQWIAYMEDHIARVENIDFTSRREAHEDWWADRWQRSWIMAEPAQSQSPSTPIPEKRLAGELAPRHAPDSLSDAEIVSRGYALQRFLTICAGRGAYPIKFNGSIFTVPYPDKPGNADYRRWGPGYWWQNTRLPYLSLFASGDTDLMHPLFEQYVDRFLPLNLYRTRHYFQHGGAYYIECVHFWGDAFNEVYGWTPFAQREDKLQQSRWHKWEWVGGLELAYLLLDYYEHTGDVAFARNQAIPTADAVVRFFDEHYEVDRRGKLVLHPAQALETWWQCTNPMPEVAGLTAVTDRLLALPRSLTAPDERAVWTRIRNQLPELPTRQVEGKAAFAPAEKFAEKRNIENPELYCVFPFRLAGFNRPNAGLALAALEHRWDQGHFGWRQDDLFMAYLGLTEDARQNIVARARDYDRNHRFPAFWGPNYDWTPDQDHGGILMKTFQSMLMQTEPVTGSEYDGKIYLFPAWPPAWNVSFKLHAPQNTVLEGEYRNGNLDSLVVIPESRRADLVILNGRP